MARSRKRPAVLIIKPVSFRKINVDLSAGLDDRRRQDRRPEHKFEVLAACAGVLWEGERQSPDNREAPEAHFPGCAVDVGKQFVAQAGILADDRRRRSGEAFFLRLAAKVTESASLS